MGCWLDTRHHSKPHQSWDHKAAYHELQAEGHRVKADTVDPATVSAETKRTRSLMQALAGGLQRLHLEEGLLACLDALLTLLLDCESTQTRFVQLQGMERVSAAWN